jgi:hypothetical protein
MLRLAHRILMQHKNGISFGYTENQSVVDKFTPMALHAMKSMESATILIADDAETFLEGWLESKAQVEFAIRDFPNARFIDIPLFVESNLTESQKGVIGLSQTGVMFLESQFPQSGEFVIAGIPWLSLDTGESFCLPLLYTLELNESGEIVFFKIFNETVLSDDLAASFLSTPIVALNLLSFKNVTHVPSPLEMRPQPKWIKRQKLPTLSYHILDLLPFKKTMQKSGCDSPGLGLAKALHMCRAHTATYTPERPLFGKYTGTYLIPPHLRGSAKHGIVDKDYRIKIPAGVTA